MQFVPMNMGGHPNNVQRPLFVANGPPMGGAPPRGPMAMGQMGGQRPPFPPGFPGGPPGFRPPMGMPGPFGPGNGMPQGTQQNGHAHQAGNNGMPQQQQPVNQTERLKMVYYATY